MYQMSRKVTYSEAGMNYKTDIAQIINYFQDCSCFQSDSLHVGPRDLENSGKLWVLNSWQIIVDRYPSYGEDITVGTWAYDFKAMMGMRNFIIDDGKGRRIAKANSIWAFLDAGKGRLVRPDETMIAAYGTESRESMDYAPRKIRLEGNFIKQEAVKVSRSCLDTNHHMNNSRYVAVAMEYLPEDFDIYQLRAEYRKSAVYGDILIPEVGNNGDKITIILAAPDGEPYVITEFTRRENI